MLRAVVAWWSCRVVLAVAPAAWERIARGAVHVERDFVPRELCEALRRDARDLHERGLFRGDGLYETGKARAAQGFSAGADRQTYTGGWAAGAGDVAARAMRSATAHIFYDQLFVKEPGTPQGWERAQNEGLAIPF